MDGYASLVHYSTLLLSNSMLNVLNTQNKIHIQDEWINQSNQVCMCAGRRDLSQQKPRPLSVVTVGLYYTLQMLS